MRRVTLPIECHGAMRGGSLAAEPADPARVSIPTTSSAARSAVIALAGMHSRYSLRSDFTGS